MLDQLPTHPYLTHPLTGEPLRAVGIVGGRIIWPIMGGDETAGGDAGSGGNGGGNGGSGGSGSGDAAAGSSGGDAGTGSGSGSGGEGGSDKTFTQADVEKLIGERLNRERAKYSDYDALKEKAAKWDKAEADKAPEIEKIRNAALEEGRAAATTEAHARLISFAARAALAEAKAINPATAVKTLDVSGVKVDKDGNVDEAALKDAVEALKKSDAYLFGNGSGSAQDAGIGAGGGNGAHRATSLADAVNAKLNPRK